MAYGNNYMQGFNPYGNYGGFQQPQQIYQPMQQQVYQQTYQQPQQQNYIPMIYVSGIEGAKAYFMNANSQVFLRDSENPNRLYYKTTDAQAKPTMIAYELNEISLDEKGNEIAKEQVVDNNVKKEDIKELVTINDFNAFKSELSDYMNNLSNDIKKSLEMAKTIENRQVIKPYYNKKGGK